MKKIKKVYSCVDIAIRLIEMCEERGIAWNYTKIKKLLYIVYGVGLVMNENKRPLMDECPKLWPYGPAFPKALEVIEMRRSDTLEDDPVRMKLSKDFNPDEITVWILDEVIKKFGGIPAGVLSDWSHQTGSPWATCMEHDLEWKSVIPDFLIYDYFKKNIVIDMPKKRRYVK